MSLSLSGGRNEEGWHGGVARPCSAAQRDHHWIPHHVSDGGLRRRDRLYSGLERRLHLVRLHLVRFTETAVAVF